jgi:deoxyhypusine synthase
MSDRRYRRKKVVDLEVKRGTTLEGMVRMMGEGGGFTARSVASAVDILEEMHRDGQSFNFLSFPACVVATGTRGVIRTLVEQGIVDALITTCGTLDHDLARVWKDYYHGEFIMDEVKLHRDGVNRLGNVLVPTGSYGIVLERKLTPLLERLYKSGVKSPSSAQLCSHLGESLEGVKGAEKSILYQAHKAKVPIFVPGITDGAVGAQLWMTRQRHPDFTVDILADESALADIVFDSKRLGALMVGGGISKHHTIWWAQFHEGLDRAVYVTTAQEHDGSLSGARVREAISWGKVKEKASYVTVDGDATVLLPLMAGALLQRLARKK